MARHQLDARGLRCPWPALRLARTMRQSAPGDEVVMIADDPKVAHEIVLLSREHGWAFARQDKDGDCVFTIMK
jgi:tRNA 2-thiouridine synthesizing protein A